MENRTRTTRLTGLFYLILVVSGIFNYMVLPSKYMGGATPSELVKVFKGRRYSLRVVL